MRGQSILASNVFESNSESKDKIIVTIVNTGSGVKERTEKDLVKMLLDEEDSAIQTEKNCFGLSISNDIIRELGGTICFKSMVDVGASFSFSIPLEK